MSKFSWKSPKLTVRTIALAALLAAIQLILSKMSVGDSHVVKISFGFIGTALIGYFMGPWLGGVIMVINDIIGNTIFNSGTVFFPGFTFSAFISGIIAGMFLHQQKVTWKRIFTYSFFQILISNVFFNTLWVYCINMVSNHPMSVEPYLITRMTKEIISFPIEATILLLILAAISRNKILKTYAN